MSITTILITGSQGLLGSALQNHIINASVKCIEFDISTKQSGTSYGDICSPNSLKQHVAHCDGIVHFAAVSRVVWGENDPEKCWQTNVEGTKNVLEAAKQSPKKPWVLLASSREVYGQQKKLPVTEAMACRPINIYARSKKAAEDLMIEYRKYGLNTAILRFSNVYGSVNDHTDRVVPAFCQAAAVGEPMRVDGFNNVFDFTHVDDVAKGVLAAITQLNNNKVLPTMHLTSGMPTTLLQLAQLANKHGGLNSDIVAAPTRNFDVSTFYGDFELASQMLNWQPKVTLEQGVRQLVQDFANLNRNKLLTSHTVGANQYENTKSYPWLPA